MVHRHFDDETSKSSLEERRQRARARALYSYLSTVMVMNALIYLQTLRRSSSNVNRQPSTASSTHRRPPMMPIVRKQFYALLLIVILIFVLVLHWKCQPERFEHERASDLRRHQPSAVSRQSPLIFIGTYLVIYQIIHVF